MSVSQEFRLPDVGEGLTEAEVVAWHVGVGDQVAVNDVVVEIETAKSIVELPSPHAGTVTQILVEAGQTVPVGTSLIVIGADVAGDPPPTVGSGAVSEPASEADEEAPAVLVGPGPTEAAARKRRLGGARSFPGTMTVPPGPGSVRTSPPAGVVARQGGDELDPLAGAVGGVVTRAEVETAPLSSALPVVAVPPAEDLARRETRVPVTGVRKATAAAMVRSAFTAPHVTEWLTVDMTASLELVRRLRQDRSWAGVRVNPLTIVARAFLLAVRSAPEINASWDAEHDEIVVKHYVNLGIAAATPRGLLVPNIKDADKLDLRSLASSLETLVATARAGKTQPQDMAGGTLTITNIGALGVDAGTPILNPGESAILAFGAVRPQPWVVGGEIQVRSVTQLAMSFDHRLVDGELGSRVLARTGEILADPGTSLVYS